jgi:predicted transcriptional regulator
MTTQLAIRLDDDDLKALDELARRDGVTRSEAARRAIRALAEDTTAARNRAELDRVGALVGIRAGSKWLSGAEALTSTPDADFAADIAEHVGHESTDDMIDPWSR